MTSSRNTTGDSETDSPERPLPPYSYVPGGPWPHPKSHPDGHSHHSEESSVVAMEPARWEASERYREGIRLFDAGFYWEAHEAWESLWHAAGRSGATADFLKALIKLAAAGVKLREGVPQGASTHAGRAEGIFVGLIAQVGPRFAGQDLNRLAEFAKATKSDPAIISIERRRLTHDVVFPWRLGEGEKIGIREVAQSSGNGSGSS